jgi:hypothetical protein
MVSIPQPGSLVGPIGKNRYGWQIFQFLDPQDGQWRYVVHLPDGRLLYSDQAGDIGHGGAGFGAKGAGAVLGGAGGFLIFSMMGLGPIGLLSGSILGALLGNQLERRRKS